MGALIKPLDDGDLAMLHAKFVVPLIVSDILYGHEKLDDVTEYAMEDILTALEPDTALLCLALCAQHVAVHTGHLPIAGVMGLEANRIVEDYGPFWLAYVSGMAQLDDRVLQDILRHVPEDLEALGDMLLAVAGDLDEAHAIPAILADILGQAAHAHRDMAESRIEDMEARYAEKIASAAGNVILFPGAHRG